MGDRLLAALTLPAEARVDQRVPKKLLLEHGAPTAADRRHVQEGVEEILWMAALRPATVGIPAYRDESREYLEIAVLMLALRPGAKAARIAELVHRAIPYPVVLVVAEGERAWLSLAHKRRSQAEVDAFVLERAVATAPLSAPMPPAGAAFVADLALAAQPREQLHATYQGWINRVDALAAAAVTGSYSAPRSPERAEARHAALEKYAQLQREIATLRARALKETQLPRRVELNLELRRLDAHLARITIDL